MRPWPNPYLNLFRLVVWIGILVNLAFALSAFFDPYGLQSFLGLPPVHPAVWLRATGGLLLLWVLLSIPAASAPFRYKANAAVLVLGWLGFGLFWAWVVLFAGYPRAYLRLAIVDLGLGLVQAIVYVLMMRYEYLRPELPDEPAAP